MAGTGLNTGLKARFARTIGHLGPIPLAQYMAESNAYYYAHRDPLGVTGDFITAPEISQMFGEMIGAWLADVTLRAGVSDVHYVELGPGRGTLARDAIRVLDRAGIACDVHLVEASPVLRRAQSETLSGRTVVHHEDVGALPESKPLLVVANEFFDALPVRQLVLTAAGWREIVVAVHDDRLVPVAGDRPMDAAVPADRRDAEEGTIIETCPAADAIMGDIAARIAGQGGAMVALDYGAIEPVTGSSLQAVRAHEKLDPFADPGGADLTAHVDFTALADSAKRGGCRVDGMTTQGEFLLSLGIAQRAAALAKANPAQTQDIAAALDRLVSPKAMGALFKVLGLAAPQWPECSGFVSVR